ncbi:mCG147214 [Mus musculus]|nr:mCG147214 [Mus musculus]
MMQSLVTQYHLSGMPRRYQHPPQPHVPWQVLLTNHASLPAEPGFDSLYLSPQANGSKQQCWGLTNLSLSPEEHGQFTQHL